MTTHDLDKLKVAAAADNYDQLSVVVNPSEGKEEVFNGLSKHKSLCSIERFV